MSGQDRESSEPGPEYSEVSSAALERAKEAGKWIGCALAGFEIVDGYLEVDDEEFGAIVVNLKRIKEGESSWSVSHDVEVIHGSTLRRIFNDPAHRQIYLARRADDQRIQAAFDEYNPLD